MTTTLSTPSEPISAPHGQSRRTAWTILVVTLVAAAGVVLAVVLPSRLGGHLASAPRELYYASGVHDSQSKWPVGKTLYMGSSIQPDKVVRKRIIVRKVVPNVAINTAGATIRLYLCTAPPGNVSLDQGEATNLSKACAASRPFSPGPVTLGFPATAIVYAITLHKPGRVRITGSTVSYLDDVRLGTQRAGSGVEVSTRT